MLRCSTVHRNTSGHRRRQRRTLRILRYRQNGRGWVVSIRRRLGTSRRHRWDCGVLNGISRSHQRFLNAGGLGILVGYGQLPNPGTEKIFEGYYSIPLSSWARLTFDYQFISNPAYNRDRGPVSVFGTRVRAQF